MDIPTLARTLSAVAGMPVEITVRADRHFTFSTDVVSSVAMDKLAAYFAPHAKHWSVTHDEECGSYLYVEL
jgi:ribosomal protein L11